MVWGIEPCMTTSTKLIYDESTKRMYVIFLVLCPTEIADTNFVSLRIDTSLGFDRLPLLIPAKNGRMQSM